MRILMLGNSYTFYNELPSLLAELTGAEVVRHTRGGARLSEEKWDYVVLQEMSNGPVTAPKSFFSSVDRLCGLIRENGAVPVLYATWAYQKGGAELLEKGWDYDEMARGLAKAYRRAAEENGALLAAVGDRFYELSASENLYDADGSHPNERGSRVAAETIAAVIRKHEEERA